MLAGVLIFGVINYGLTFIGVNPYWQLIIKGLIIIKVRLGRNILLYCKIFKKGRSLNVAIFSMQGVQGKNYS